MAGMTAPRVCGEGLGGILRADTAGVCCAFRLGAGTGVDGKAAARVGGDGPDVKVLGM